MLTSLSLRNFKKHESLDLSFDKGLNLIAGRNYAGKSTILNAIMYALGGSAFVPGQPQRRGTNSGLLVSLEFVLGGDTYRVDRKKSVASLLKNSEPVAHGHAPVSAEISRLLGCDLKRFRQLRYAQQKKAHAMLSYGAAELNSLIEDITKASSVSAAIVKLSDLIKTVSGSLDALENPDVDAFRQEAERAEERKTVAQDELNGVTAGHASALGTLAQVEAMNAQAEEKAKVHNRLVNKLSQLRREVEILEAGVARRQQEVRDAGTPLSAEEIATRSAELSALEDEEKAYQRKLAAYQHARAEFTRLTGKCQAAEEAVIRLEAELILVSTGYSQELLDQLTQEFRQAEAAERDNRAALQRSNDALSSLICPTCERPFDEQEIAREQQKNTELAEDLAKAVEVRQTAERAATEFSRQADRIRAKERDLLRARDELRSWRESLQAVNVEPVEDRPASDLQARRQQLAEASSARRQYDRAVRDLATDEKNWKEALAALDEVTAEFQGSDYQPDEAAEITQAVRRARDTVNAIASMVSEAKAEVTQAQGAAARAYEALQEAQEKADRYGAMARRLDVAKTLQKFLRDGRDRYTGMVWDSFLASASDFASRCTDGDIEEVRRTADGKFVFVEGGDDVDMEEASGAQASIIGLGVQLAMADAAGCPLDILLVDEPTADMDPDRSLATAAIMANLGKQVILVSHSQMDSSMAANVISLGA